MSNLKNIIQSINDKDLDKALKLCKLYENKKNSDIIFNLKGVVYLLKNDLEMAENSFLHSIKINKSFLDPLKNLYTVYHKRKKINEMLSIANELVDKDNKNPSFYYKLAYALEINNKFDEAIKCYENCINLNGKEKKYALNNIGNIYLKKNRPKISIKYFLEAFNLDQYDKIILNNLLSNYIELRDEKNSDFYYKKAEIIDPNFSEFLFNKANYLFIKNQIEKAVEILKSNKNQIRFLTKLIKIYFTIGRIEDAKALLKENENIIKKNENFINFLGMRYLYEGNFELGWKYYEYRPSKIKNFLPNIKEWKGEDLNSKVIAVYNEQGLGDTIQFSKFIIPLLKISKKVILVVPKKIQNLFKTDFENLDIENNETIKIKKFDYKISLGSLLKYFYKNHISSDENLIRFEKNSVDNWKKEINKTKLNVGIAWSGSFNGPNEPFRSIPLKSLEKIFSLDINFYNLQSEIWDRDLDFFKSSDIIDFSKYDLNEISSIIPNLDLVISSDTFLLHLSASLNQETWGILNLYPDWRWGEFYKINPYNTVKLFHQKEFNNWKNVEHEIFENLNKKLT
mgnify:FL=1